MRCAILFRNSCRCLKEGEQMIKKLSENILDKFSMDFLRSQVLKNAYGNNDTVIAIRDPRVLLIWYLFFGLVPWFVQDRKSTRLNSSHVSISYAVCCLK